MSLLHIAGALLLVAGGALGALGLDRCSRRTICIREHLAFKGALVTLIGATLLVGPVF